jgi:CDP-diacylglycerol--glycerol-3-phosphate 3-phosphatidyltransferase
MPITIPNLLTLLRLALLPLFILVFYLPFQWSYAICAIIFVLAAITDWIDGYLARLLNQESAFGRFCDPVADKLMVMFALIVLVQFYATAWFTLPALVIVGREFVVSALREWMAELGKRASVAVTYIAKVKTAAQMVAIGTLLVAEGIGWTWLAGLGFFLLYMSAVLTLWTMMVYLKAAWDTLAVTPNHFQESRHAD